MEIKPAKRSKLTLYIGIALVAGIIAGFIINKIYVGTENNQIANAEIQLAHIDNAIRPFETIKDTVRYNSLRALQMKASTQKKEAEAALLNTPDEAAALLNIKLLSDSVKQLQIALSGFSDTSGLEYKSLLQQRELVTLQKNNSIKARDTKLDWLTILADIFLRLIKMIVAPLVLLPLLWVWPNWVI